MKWRRVNTIFWILYAPCFTFSSMNFKLFNPFFLLALLYWFWLFRGYLGIAFTGEKRVPLVLAFPRIVFLLLWSFGPVPTSGFILFFNWTIYLFIYFEKRHRKLPDNLFSYRHTWLYFSDNSLQNIWKANNNQWCWSGLSGWHTSQTPDPK